MPNELTFYSMRGSAVYLGISYRHMRYLVYKKHEIEPDQMFGKTWVFTQETLDKWKADHKEGNGDAIPAQANGA